MKFQHVNVRNLRWLVPPWAADYMAIARALDGMLEQKRQLRGPETFWVELVAETGYLRIAVKDETQDNSGQFIIIGKGWQIELPLRSILRNGDPCIENLYTVYFHSIQTGVPLAYVGVTKRPWFKRLAEHEGSAARGSRYFFHDALRRHHDVQIAHKVIAAGVDQECAFRLEEAAVAELTLYPMGLNMIPGGLAGLRYLAAQGFKRTSTETIDVDMIALMDRPSVDGRPNPLCAARWASDPDYAERVICGHSGRLTAAQLRQIRLLATLGRTAMEIVLSTGARHVKQVLRAISGRTYGRVA